MDINGDYCTYSELLLGSILPSELQRGKEIAKVGINLTSVCLNLRRAPNVKADRVWVVLDSMVLKGL